MKKATRVHYEGRVQGVGFRWTTRSIATGFEVAGTVRNLPDGRVELCIAGEAEEVDAFLTAIREGELAGNIRNETAEEWNDVPKRLQGFQILS